MYHLLGFVGHHKNILKQIYSWKKILFFYNGYRFFLIQPYQDSTAQKPPAPPPIF